LSSISEANDLYMMLNCLYL